MTDTEKLDALLTSVARLTNQFLRLDQNQTVLVADIEAETATNAGFRAEVRATLGRLETAVVELAKDVWQTRERLADVDRRVRLLESRASNGHG